MLHRYDSLETSLSQTCSRAEQDGERRLDGVDSRLRSLEAARVAQEARLQSLQGHVASELQRLRDQTGASRQPLFSRRLATGAKRPQVIRDAAAMQLYRARPRIPGALQVCAERQHAATESAQSRLRAAMDAVEQHIARESAERAHGRELAHIASKNKNARTQRHAREPTHTHSKHRRPIFKSHQGGAGGGLVCS